MEDAPLGCLLEVLSWPLDAGVSWLFDCEKPDPPPSQNAAPAHPLDRPLVRMPPGASRLSTGTCASCGASRDRPVVHCSKCGTRHHADCWRWLGRCAIYGCGAENAD